MKPRLPNELDPKPKDNDLVVGDLHADLVGLKNLLKECNWNTDNQKVFLLGDLLDRGVEAKELLNFKKQYGLFSILGNHEHFHQRNTQHLITQSKTGKKPPTHLTPEKKHTFNQFADQNEYIRYMSNIYDDFPVYLPFEDSQGKGFLVHAGFDPFNKLKDQDIDKMLVRRFHPSPNCFLKEETEEYKYWPKFYKGHLGYLLVGHHPVPTYDYFKNPWVYNLDGNGVAGKYAEWGQGVHRAMRLGDRKIFEAIGGEKSAENYRRLRIDKKNV